MPNLHTLAAKKPASKADLLDKIWLKVKPEDKIDTMVNSVVNLTQNSLNTLASTLVLIDNNKQELYFQYSDGSSGKQLQRLQIGRQSGIASWVIQHGKPMLVNNPEKNVAYYKFLQNLFLTFKPWHHFSKFCTNFFNMMLFICFYTNIKERSACFILIYPFISKSSIRNNMLY